MCQAQGAPFLVLKGVDNLNFCIDVALGLLGHLRYDESVMFDQINEAVPFSQEEPPMSLLSSLLSGAWSIRPCSKAVSFSALIPSRWAQAMMPSSRAIRARRSKLNNAKSEQMRMGRFGIQPRFVRLSG
jgi:hypothetical protein